MKQLTRNSLLLVTLLTGGCQTINDHMPTMGESCENWQCFTSDGRATSDAIKEQKQHPQQNRNGLPERPRSATADDSDAPVAQPQYEPTASDPTH